MSAPNVENAVTVEDTLTVEKVSVGYDGPLVLDRVSVTAQPGRIMVILGPNGAGKSTLAKAVFGLLGLKAGRIQLNGKDVSGVPAHKRVAAGMAYLPQLANVFDQLSIIENLQMGGYTMRGKLDERVGKVLDLFPDLARDRHKKSGALSGGQQRMLALARMLMTDPVVGILDEPTAGLSPLYAERVWEHIGRIRDLGVALLVVEQNAAMAMDHADGVCVLAQGRNVLTGAAAELRQHDEIARILVG
jgi:ABC-type branched-subunit amino acid transport system ATPase component